MAPRLVEFRAFMVMNYINPSRMESIRSNKIKQSKRNSEDFPTVDGRNPANQLIWRIPTIIYKVLYIPDGCLGFLPSTVSLPKVFLWFPEGSVRFPFSKTNLSSSLKLMRVHTSYTEIFDINTHVTLRM